MESISVIIPTYDRGEMLLRAIDSAVKQTRPAHEIIVVDDGSQDSTQADVACYFPDVRYIYQENAGVSCARNTGVSAAAGSWVAFLDSDDEWVPDKLHKQHALWRLAPQHKIVHSNEFWIRSGVRVNKPTRYASKGGWVFDYCLGQCAISPSTVVIEKQLFKDCGGFREDFPVCEDYDLWLKICHQYPVLLCDEELSIKYAGHSNQLSMNNWGMDRYRVIAMLDLLEKCDEGLSVSNREKLISELDAKCSILKSGAVKRDNRELIDFVDAVTSKLSRIVCLESQ